MYFERYFWKKYNFMDFERLQNAYMIKYFSRKPEKILGFAVNLGRVGLPLT